MHLTVYVYGVLRKCNAAFVSAIPVCSFLASQRWHSFNEAINSQIYNDFIGCTLATDLHRPDEAIPYLSRALIRCVSSLLRIVIGYVNAYFDQGRFLDAIDILQLSLSFCSGLRRPGQNSFLDKISTEFYVYLTEAQAGLGLTDEARESLRAARALAEQFDRAPDYSVDSVRFVANDRPGSAFDNMGATAMECILDLLETRKSEELTALWHEITAEESVQG